MSAGAAIPALPNPLTSMAWLPPELAHEFEVSRYIGAIAVGAWIWDILMGFADEVRMFKRQKTIRLPDVIYILARIGTGCFLWNTLIFNTAEVPDCERLVKAIGWTGALSLPLNSLLFLFRVYAIFDDVKFVKIIFTCMWVGTIGCCFTAPFALSGAHIGTTDFCIFSRVKAFGSAGIVAMAVNDTLVCTAITLRIVMSIPASNMRERMNKMMSGEGMGYITKVVLQGGQQYYLATVGFNICAAVVILSPSVPIPYGNVLAVPNGFLLNAMAARVFRQLKLGRIKDIPMTTVASRTIQFSLSNVSKSSGGRQPKDTTFDTSMPYDGSVTTNPVIALHSLDDMHKPHDIV